MFIGDGMGLSTVVATRIYKGQLDDLPFGEEGHLYMESFPYIGTSKVTLLLVLKLDFAFINNNFIDVLQQLASSGFGMQLHSLLLWH